MTTAWNLISQSAMSENDIDMKQSQLVASSLYTQISLFMVESENRSDGVRYRSYHKNTVCNCLHSFTYGGILS